MKFTNLKIRNFLSIGEAEMSLADLGLVMVAGENQDETSANSNGSGKSSLADAVSWCLWGKTARGVSGDDVVNAAAGKDTCVSITVDDGGEVYRVDRYRKAPKFKNGLFLYKQDDQGGWIDITKGKNSLTQTQVERLLGCSEEVFNAAVYSGQEQMPDIPNMTDRQLKVLVEQAAGVDVLTNAYEIARERARERSQVRAQAQITLDRAKQRQTDATASLKRLSDQSAQWALDQKAKVDRLKQATIDAKTEYELSKEDVDEEAEQKLQGEIDEIEAKIAAVNAERDRERVLEGDVKKAEQVLQVVQRNIENEKACVRDTRKAIADAEAHLAHVKTGVGKPCKTCTRPLEEEHLEGAVKLAEKNLAEQQAALENAIEQQAKVEAKVPAAEKLLKGAQSALAKHRAAMTDVTAESQRLGNLRRELQIVERAKQEVERLRTSAISSANTWKQAAAEKNPFESMIGQADQELVEMGTAVAEAKAAQKAASEEEEYAQAVVEVFAPSGVRAHRLDEATPYLNERTAHYLGSLADGAIEAFWTTLTEKANGDLAERFSVTVEKQGSAPSFAALSGGEKRKVRLACALALQDLVATRAAKNIELWVGDEIDDALDDAGLERLMGVLEEKARDRGSVLVISHNDIRDFARKTITVTKAGGRATVSVA